MIHLKDAHQSLSGVEADDDTYDARAQAASNERLKAMGYDPEVYLEYDGEVFKKPPPVTDDDINACALFATPQSMSGDDLENHPAKDQLAAIQEVLFSPDATAEEKADHFKEKGNECMKRASQAEMRKGRIEWNRDSIQWYTKALDEKCADAKRNSVYLSNRAQAHLNLKNYRSAFDDCKAASEANSGNMKAYWRGAKAAIGLGMPPLALKMAQKGLLQTPGDKELMALVKDAEAKLAAIAKENDDRRKRVSEDADALKQQYETVHTMCAARGVMVGAHVSNQRLVTENLAHPWVEDNGSPMGLVHWPVLFLYDEHDQSDFVQDVAEDVPLIEELHEMFPHVGVTAWDIERKYSFDNIDLYLELNACRPTAGAVTKASEADGKPRWAKVDPSLTLGEALQTRGFVMPALPVIHAIIRNSAFEAPFLAHCPYSGTRGI